MAKDKCTKGYSCGDACISRRKDCTGGASPEASQAADRLQNLVKPKYTSLAQIEATSEVLGQGDNGKAFKTANGSVLKVLLSDYVSDISAFEAERDALERFGKIGIAPKLLSAGELEDGKRFIEMEMLEGYRTAGKRVDGTDELEISVSEGQARKVREALEAMHKAGYAHGDVYVLNTLVNDETDDAKLIDFGFAVDSSEAAVLYDLQAYEREFDGRWPDESLQGKLLGEIEELEDFGEMSKEDEQRAKRKLIKAYIKELNNA